MVKSRACQELDTKVIKAGLCTLCGACAGICPYLTAYEGRILLRDICDLPEGRCKAFCPRISLNLDDISKVVFGIPYPEDDLGTAQRVIMAQASDSGLRARAQDAGVVTALINFAIEEGSIDSAILTSFEGKSWPMGRIALSGEEVLKCSGSSYLAAPTVEAFNRAIQDVNRQNIGFVGTPCQVMALAKMRTAPPQMSKEMHKLKLVVGLFCTWALSYPALGNFLGRRISDLIVRYEIPPHPTNVLIAYTEKDHISFPIDEILPFVRPACRFCLDLTAEFADISVGGGRGEVLNWNTLVIRTKKGARLVDSATKRGVIETTPIPEGNLNRVKAAAYNKKKRALGNIIQKTGRTDDPLYLETEPETIKQLTVRHKEWSF